MTSIELAERIREIAKACRLPLHNEKAAQTEFSRALAAAGVEHQREVHLSARDIVDFMAEGIAIELKIKGPRNQILRQLTRYAEHGRVEQLLLITCRSLVLPEIILGKPLVTVHASGAWL